MRRYGEKLPGILAWISMWLQAGAAGVDAAVAVFARDGVMEGIGLAVGFLGLLTWGVMATLAIAWPGAVPNRLLVSSTVIMVLGLFVWMRAYGTL